MKTYQHKVVEKLGELFTKYRDAIRKEAGPIYGFIWTGIAPEVPNMLAILDGKPELLEKLRIFTLEMAEAFEEDKKLKEIARDA